LEKNKNKIQMCGQKLDRWIEEREDLKTKIKKLTLVHQVHVDLGHLVHYLHITLDPDYFPVHTYTFGMLL
jgi:hypothetical protein